MPNHPWESEPTQVHLVMLPDRAGIYLATLDEQKARRHAESIKGVVASIQLSGDYRDVKEAT